MAELQSARPAELTGGAAGPGGAARRRLSNMAAAAEGDAHASADPDPPDESGILQKAEQKSPTWLPRVRARFSFSMYSYTYRSRALVLFLKAAMPEWSKGNDSSSFDFGRVGSNPTRSKLIQDEHFCMTKYVYKPKVN